LIGFTDELGSIYESLPVDKGGLRAWYMGLPLDRGRLESSDGSRLCLCILASCDLYASWIGYDNIIFNAITSANAFDIDPKFMKFTTPA
jgi:hypothetical protein